MKRRKEIIRRCLIGAPIGVLICNITLIAISLVVNDGNYYSVVPELISYCGSETNAVIVQTICVLLYGAMWGGISVVWEIDEWSILRQTLTHFVICTITTIPIAYFTGWMSHSLLGLIKYIAIFVGVYLMVWLSQYSSMKKKVEQLNRKLDER